MLNSASDHALKRPSCPEGRGEQCASCGGTDYPKEGGREALGSDSRKRREGLLVWHGKRFSSA